MSLLDSLDCYLLNNIYKMVHQMKMKEVNIDFLNVTPHIRAFPDIQAEKIYRGLKRISLDYWSYNQRGGRWYYRIEKGKYP